MELLAESGDSQMIFNIETQGESRKFLQPSADNDPKLQELKMFLIDWINDELKQEHIIVQSLEEDLFDGLILHHLLQKIGNLTLEVEEITLSTINQKRKLGVILQEVSRCLQLEGSQLKWSVALIHSKDLLATLHLLIALAQHFHPDLPLPANVSIEVVVVEPTKTGMKTGKAIECFTGSREEDAAPKKDAFDQLFEMNPDRINDVKQAIVNFVNKQLVNLSLTVNDLDSQFADGVILLLLIGQVEGYFIPLSTFFLCPGSTEDRLHNVILALDLLMDGGILTNPADAAEIVNRDLKTTLRVLYSLFLKHKNMLKSS
ncbi:PREDICTED: gamma-parvin [Nanorana parkeri]|uniref:gamma-parvin n=1 Tax=Nanorana parkeri TaxID=125878 RepID=UPI0008541D7A|nr:PREDICTED: gamma-parvin [Nanorana parkeri]